MRPIIQSDLDKAALKGCSNPNCKKTHEDGVVFLRCSNCLDEESLEISYQLLSGILTVGCQNCEEVIAFIKVDCCL